MSDSLVKYEDAQKIYAFNNLVRYRLLKLAEQQPTDRDKVQFVVDYFTNNLPKDITAQIDDVSEEKVVNFNYDYTFVSGNETLLPRKQELVRYPLGRCYTLPCAMRDIDLPGRPKIYPTIFALKLGTCVMFSNELQRLMLNLGIKSEIVDTPTCVDCYDRFDGVDIHYNKINVNEIKKIRHSYNIVEVDNEKYKIDIAGYLTAQDFNINKPKKYKENIDINRFCMTKDLYSNPFEEINVRTLNE